MTNTNLLETKIRDSGLRIGYICEQVGISYPGFQKKMRNEGKSEFKPSEIVVLRELLRLTPEEVDQIFFAEKVGDEPTVS